MFDDPFYCINQSEAFSLSRCMYHEHAVTNLISSLLLNLGYESVQHRIWQKNQKKVIVCFADDFGVCRTDYSLPPRHWFDKDTTVITDNYLPTETEYTVIKTPSSYFGNFHYVPALQEYNPNKRFHLSVNRLDSQRLLLFMEFLDQFPDTDNDYINFNARLSGNPSSKDELLGWLDATWNQMSMLHPMYRATYSKLRPLVPVRNHNLSIEQANLSAYLNIVIETYAGDATIAFSEKIFRALVTPAPWTVYSARGAVDYLRKLGFDTLDDIVDHSYNQDTQDDSIFGIDKVRSYMHSNKKIYEHLLTLDSDVLKQRCSVAARKNQQILKNMSQQWPSDFAQWLPNVIETIQ